MTLDELTEPLTPDEVREAIYAAIAARGAEPTSWKALAPTRSMIAGIAIVVSALSRLIAAVTKGGFLEKAEKDWLTFVALYVYDVARGTGTFATGSVEIDNAGAGVYAFAAGDLIVVSTATGKGYRNTSAVNIAAGQLNVAVDVEAIELGSASTAPAGTIDDFETPQPGLTVTNPTALLGSDPEDDAALKARCYEKTGTLSPNGPRDAYAFVARSTVKSDGTTAGVTRVRTVADGQGGVDVYVADGSGALAGAIGNTATALGAVDDAIQRLAAPLAVTASTQSATAVSIAVTYQVWVRDTSGRSSAQIEEAIGDELARYMAAAPIGGHVIPGEATGRVYKSAIEAAIDAALEGVSDDDDFVIRRAVTVPAGDTDLAIGQAPVLGVVASTITQVSETTI